LGFREPPAGIFFNQRSKGLFIGRWRGVPAECGFVIREGYAIWMGCGARLPLRTHFMWHVLNAVMPGWVIEFYRAITRLHALEGPVRPR